MDAPAGDHLPPERRIVTSARKNRAALPPGPVRLWLQGAFTPLALTVALITGSVFYWPDWVGLGTAARALDSLVPQLLLVSLVLCCVVALLGAPRIAVFGLCLSLSGGIALVWRHLDLAEPTLPTAQTDVTVLWFNMFAANTTQPEALISALVASEADVVILGEASPLKPYLTQLEESFPYHIGCQERRCELLVLARLPLRGLRLRNIGTVRAERQAIVELDLDGRAPLTLIGVHMVKPWFFSFIEVDNWFLRDTLTKTAGPLVVVGDFNVAPWGRPMIDLFRNCGLSPSRMPHATWPASAGWAGVPLDQVLVRDGARLRDLQIWGADQGSNHLGLMAKISLPPAGFSNSPPERPQCI